MVECGGTLRRTPFYQKRTNSPAPTLLVTSPLVANVNPWDRTVLLRDISRGRANLARTTGSVSLWAVFP